MDNQEITADDAIHYYQLRREENDAEVEILLSAMISMYPQFASELREYAAYETLLDSVSEHTYTHEEEAEIVRAGQRVLKSLLAGEQIGYNNALEWAASWIESSVASDDQERVREFASNMAMSIRAAKRKSE